jgi:hypothetical protein
MDFNTTIDIIIKDLKEAREIIEDLKQYPGVPQIQVELAKSKCKSAEEIMALLKTLNKDYKLPHDKEADGVENSKVTKPVEPVINDKLVEITEEAEIKSAKLSVEKKKEPEIIDRTINHKPSVESDTVIRKKQREKTPEKNIVADKFTAKSDTLHEQLGSKKIDLDISEVIKSIPVSNLSEAIGLNDKFIFIQEIFNGDQKSYNEAISKLNKVNNLSDAKAIIMSYTGEGDENDAVIQLLELVKRKLPADE